MHDLLSEKIELRKKQGSQYFSVAEISKPDEKEAKLGTFYLLLDYEAQEKNATKIFEIVLHIFEEEYYGRKEEIYLRNSETISSLFEEALAKLNKAFETLVNEGYLEDPKKVNACVAIIKENEIHLASIGNIKTFLIRDDRMLELTQYEEAKKGQDIRSFSNVISGTVKTGDILLLTTKEILNYFSNEKIKR
ncbi:hypothetical protein KKC60_03770, partial [Patescibacteria group bacterium]|nr:hypothetical protein [Patescibacteria group bacterium]